MKVLSLAALIVVILAGPAAAGPQKIALTEIEGDDSGSIREAVAEALDGNELSVIGAKETNRAVDKLKDGVSSLSEKQAKKLSTDLEVAAIVYGELGKEGKSKLLKLRMFVNGKKVKGFSVQFTNARSKKFKEGVRDKMIEKLSVPEPAKKAPNDDEDPIKAKKKKTAKTDTDEDDDTKKPDKKKKATKTEPDEGDEGDEGDEDDKPKKGKKKTAKVDPDGEVDEDGEVKVRVRSTGSAHAANRVAARIDVGVSASLRTLVFTSTPELRQADQDPKPFKQGGPVPGARVEAEIYPLAFSNPKGIAGGLGIAFEFDRVLSSKVQTSAEPGSVGKVNQTHYTVGARFRIPFGSSQTAPSVTLGAGYGRRTFKVASGLMDRSSLDLPDTDYTFIAPALGFRIPITKNIALTAIAEGVLVQDAGPIVTGEEYGRARVFGFDTEGGLDIVLGNRFAIKLAFEMCQIGYSFTGGGQKANNRDGDATTIDIGGALDRSIGGVGTFAVLY
jgi:hypothetical protein